MPFFRPLMMIVVPDVLKQRDIVVFFFHRPGSSPRTSNAFVQSVCFFIRLGNVALKFSSVIPATSVDVWLFIEYLRQFQRDAVVHQIVPLPSVCFLRR